MTGRTCLSFRGLLISKSVQTLCFLLICRLCVVGSSARKWPFENTAIMEVAVGKEVELQNLLEVRRVLSTAAVCQH